MIMLQDTIATRFIRYTVDLYAALSLSQKTGEMSTDIEFIDKNTVVHHYNIQV